MTSGAVTGGGHSATSVCWHHATDVPTRPSDGSSYSNLVAAHFAMFDRHIANKESNLQAKFELQVRPPTGQTGLNPLIRLWAWRLFGRFKGVHEVYMQIFGKIDAILPKSRESKSQA